MTADAGQLYGPTRPFTPGQARRSTLRLIIESVLPDNHKPSRLARNYGFSEFALAKRVAEIVGKSTGSGALIARNRVGFRVAFKATWLEEVQIISETQNFDEPFRSGEKYSNDELNCILELFIRWFSVDEIAVFLKRKPSAIATSLEQHGLVDRVYLQISEEALQQDVFVDKDSHSIAVFYPEKLFEAGALNDSRRSTIEIRIDTLTDSELRMLYELLVQSERSDAAICLAQCANDPLKAYRIARASDKPPNAVYPILRSTDKLPNPLAYQLELLKSTLLSRMIEQFPSAIGSWVQAAKARTKDYSKHAGVVPPDFGDFGLSLDDVGSLRDDLRAFAETNNVNVLMRLTREGDRLAAAIVSDSHRRSMWLDSTYSLDSADEPSQIQDGYWPDPVQIQVMLQSRVNYNKLYAKRFRSHPFRPRLSAD